MDVDAYAEVHRAEWARLEELAGRRALSGAEADEMLDLYQRTATHLSVVRSLGPDPALVRYLSWLLARVRTRAAGTRVTTWSVVRSFLLERFPAALYRLRRWWLATMAANVAVTAVMMVWLLQHPAVEQSLIGQRQIDELVTNDVEGYYHESAASHFATQVWVNNSWVAALCVSLGVLGLPVMYLLFTNIANLAIIGAIMTRYDRGSLFWGLILPHGLLELTAVFVAGGVGLRLCWAWIAPGATTRARSLAREGRTAGTCVLGLALLLAVSGAIEGFVTPSGLPTWARVGIGVLAEVAFFAYVFVLGRAAVARGHSGDIDAALLEDRVASVA